VRDIVHQAVCHRAAPDTSACELTGSVSGPTQLGLESMQGDTDCTQAQTVQITLVTNSNTKAT